MRPFEPALQSFGLTFTVWPGLWSWGYARFKSQFSLSVGPLSFWWDWS